MRDCHFRVVINKGHGTPSPEEETTRLGCSWFAAMPGRCMLSEGHQGSHRTVYKHIKASTMDELNEMCRRFKAGLDLYPPKSKAKNVWIDVFGLLVVIGMWVGFALLMWPWL